MPVRSGLFALAVLLAGCGGGLQTFSSAQEAYDEGVAEFENGKCGRAIEYLRTALDFGRTSALADDAQLTLARAYACDRQYLLAGTEFTRFIEFYRADPRIEQAAFERIQAYAELSPRYELDQTDTRQALGYISLYLQQYPESPNTEAASALAAELNEKLARKKFEAGRLYERREIWEAAVLTYRDVLAEYPTSAYADDALLGAIRSQIAYAGNSIPARQAERYTEALDIYQQLITLFPQSPLLGEAEDLYDAAFRGARAAGTEDATASGE
ncbi:MAG: outer membrane protein assembly factor BamD [Bacteroidota bacterium]